MSQPSGHSTDKMHIMPNLIQYYITGHWSSATKKPPGYMIHKTPEGFLHEFFNGLGNWPELHVF